LRTIGVAAVEETAVATVVLVVPLTGMVVAVVVVVAGGAIVYILIFLLWTAIIAIKRARNLSVASIPITSPCFLVLSVVQGEVSEKGPCVR
jgi:hypothetical protein